MLQYRHLRIAFCLVFITIQCKATSIIVLGTSKNVIIASDSKKAWVGSRVGGDKEPTNKVVLLNDRTIAAVTGFAGGGNVHWDALEFLNGVRASLPKDASVSGISDVIHDRLQPYFKDFDSIVSERPSEKQKAFPDRQLVGFIVAGYENGVPKVEINTVFIDWHTLTVHTGPPNPEVFPNSGFVHPFGEIESITAAANDPSSPEREAAAKFPGFAKLISLTRPADLTLSQAIDAATDMVRFEVEVHPQNVGTPINVVVLSPKDKPVCTTVQK